MHSGARSAYRRHSKDLATLDYIAQWFLAHRIQPPLFNDKYFLNTSPYYPKMKLTVTKDYLYIILKIVNTLTTNIIEK